MILFLAQLTVLLVAAGVPIAFAMGASTIASMLVFLTPSPQARSSPSVSSMQSTSSARRRAAVHPRRRVDEYGRPHGPASSLTSAARLFGWIKGDRLGYVTVATAIFLSGIFSSELPTPPPCPQDPDPCEAQAGLRRHLFSTSLVAAFRDIRSNHSALHRDDHLRLDDQHLRRKLFMAGVVQAC